MRILSIAGAVLALIAADGASAQRVVRHGPGAGYPVAGSSLQGADVRQPARSPAQVSRWGSRIGGRWWGGANAPGGWNAYRRPTRGWALPPYWVAPRFYVSDWEYYGLATPPRGYNWTRYYDDAVLIDAHGSVYDTVGGVDWDRYDAADYARGYDGGGYDGQGYPRRSDGVGGAVAGAVVGGVAGNLIAGRGNRVGGTLIGAGVGAVAGHAIDRAEDRGRPAPPPPPPPSSRRGYGADYPPPPVVHRGSNDWVSPDGTTTVTTTSGGYHASGSGVTTVTVHTAPVVTTTTTEIYEDAVTYTPRPARKVWRRKVWKARPACYCK